MTTEAPPLSREDADHLRWLSISHYVLGGLTVICGFFPIIYLVMGIAMLTGNFNDHGDPPFVGGILIAIAMVGMLLIWGTAALLFAAGRSLRACRRRGLCLAAAILACIVLQPMGTVLCAFTMIVLFRSSVREAFEANDPRSTPTRF